MKIITHLKSVHGVQSDNQLIDSLQDHRLISDQVLTVDEIPPADLINAYNRSMEK